MCFKICQTSASVLKFEILPWCEPIPQIKGNICKKIKWNATDLHVNVNDCCQICKLATKRAQRGINLAFTAATKWDLCIFLCDAKWCRYILQILKCVCLYSRKIDFHMQSQYLIPILRYKEKTFEIPRKNMWRQIPFPMLAAILKQKPNRGETEASYLKHNGKRQGPPQEKT